MILHSDRGCQFTSDETQRFLKGHPLQSSMSRVGSGAHSAAAEGFFGLLKRERGNRRQSQTRTEARADVFDSIERFHNPRRAGRVEQRRGSAIQAAFSVPPLSRVLKSSPQIRHIRPVPAGSPFHSRTYVFFRLLRSTPVPTRESINIPTAHGPKPGTDGRDTAVIPASPMPSPLTLPPTKIRVFAPRE